MVTLKIKAEWKWRVKKVEKRRYYQKPSKKEEEEEEKAKKKKRMEHVKLMIEREKWTLTWSVTSQIISVLAQLLLPLLTGEIIDICSRAQSDDKSVKARQDNILVEIGCDIMPYFNCNRPLDLARSVVIMFVLVTLFVSIVTLFNSTVKRYASQNMLRYLRGELFESLILLDIATFDETGSNALMSRLSSDVQSVGDVLSMDVVNRIGDVFLLIGCFIFVAFLDWRLTVALLTTFPFIAYSSKKFARIFKEKSKKTQDELAHAAQVCFIHLLFFSFMRDRDRDCWYHIIYTYTYIYVYVCMKFFFFFCMQNGQIAGEALGNIRTVRSFSREDYHVMQYTEKLEETTQIGYHMAWSRGYFRAVETFLDGLGIAIMLFLGSTLVIHNQLSVGNFTTFILYSMKINNNFIQMLDLFSSVL
ncbi:abc transporter, partial [Reticulomyxa filosa]